MRSSRCTRAIVLAVASLALVPASGAATRVAPPEADALAAESALGLARVAPPEADALAAEFATGFPTAATAPTTAPVDRFDYTDAAVGAAATAGLGLIALGLTVRVQRRRRVLLDAH